MDTKDDVCLKEYLMTLLEERDKRIYQRFDGAEKAVTEFKQTTEKRFENANEWRNSYDDLVRTYVPRTEFNTLERDVEKMKNMKQGSSQAWVVLVAGASVLMAFIMLVYNLFKT